MSVCELFELIEDPLAILERSLAEMLEFVRSSPGQDRTVVGDGWVRMDSVLKRIEEARAQPGDTEGGVVYVDYNLREIEGWMERIRSRLEYYEGTEIPRIWQTMAAATGSIRTTLGEAGVQTLMPSATGSENQYPRKPG